MVECKNTGARVGRADERCYHRVGYQDEGLADK